jgi:hypothetical protein
MCAADICSGSGPSSRRERSVGPIKRILTRMAWSRERGCLYGAVAECGMLAVVYIDPSERFSTLRREQQAIKTKDRLMGGLTL